MAANDPNSPRQKMINLMYLVFIAMLALNVSNEVLDGFELVEESLLRSVKSSTARNQLISQELERYHATNPEKTREWYLLALKVKQKSDSLYNLADSLKWEIVRKSDGKDGNPEQLKHPEDLNAAFDILVAPGKTKGKELKADIDNYREYISSLLKNDTAKVKIIASNLSTTPSKKAKENKQTWEESMFYQMPLAAAVTILTKLQNDVRYAEGEVLNALLKSIDVSDYRVNSIQALVVPQSRMVMRGGTYSADIVLAAIDTTLQPTIVVNGRTIENGHYTEGAGGSGLRTIKGSIQMPRPDGTFGTWDFSSDYFVIEPNATIAPVYMNVLYANYENPIDIAVPGVPSQNIEATITNGTLQKSGDKWIAIPSKIGVEAKVTVTANMDGRRQEMGNRTFRVRALPKAQAFLDYKDANGNPATFRGGRIPKATLVTIGSIRAAVDDDMIRINYNVQKFETWIIDSMGSTTREVSDGANFSQRQKDLIRGLSRGKSFIIRGIVASGPNGTEDVAPLEVIVN